jgi:alkanesulfonate monooxygenase SsuD/methylene tetrahydromethanopterin reductase-like flavin-dependent oxidoreductase (luciferase family)
MMLVRTAKYGIGWTAGGASPDEVTELNQSARAAWSDAGRDGAPRLWALTYFVLGDGGCDTAAEYLTDYYGDWGPGMAQQISADAEQIRGAVTAYEASGTDEFIFNPVSSDMRQLDGLAGALGDLLQP